MESAVMAKIAGYRVDGKEHVGGFNHHQCQGERRQEETGGRAGR
jgi:hypothetical protein